VNTPIRLLDTLNASDTNILEAVDVRERYVDIERAEHRRLRRAWTAGCAKS
jgi:hypothetical protein